MFLVAIQVEALDRHKLLADVTRVLSDERVNILSATVTTTRDRVAVSRFTFEMADPKHLGHLRRRRAQGGRRLRRVPGHLGHARRLTGGPSDHRPVGPPLDAGPTGWPGPLTGGAGGRQRAVGAVVTEVGVIGPAVTVVKVSAGLGMRRRRPAWAYAPSSPPAATFLTTSRPSIDLAPEAVVRPAVG